MDRDNILDDIYVERMAQIDKWGIQHHESYNTELASQGLYGEKMCLHYGIPKEVKARLLCQKHANPDWGHIVIEELSEAISTDNKEDLRKELIQVAACLVAWVEDLDTEDPDLR